MATDETARVRMSSWNSTLWFARCNVKPKSSGLAEAAKGTAVALARLYKLVAVPMIASLGGRTRV